MDLTDLMKHIDMSSISNIAKKAGLSEEKSGDIMKWAADAVKYRVNKEEARGRSEKVASLLSEQDNTEEDNIMASKMEEDFVYNLTNKMGLPDNIANMLKGNVMKKVLSGVTSSLSSKGSNSMAGILDNFGDSDMLKGIKNKLSNLF